LRKNAQLTYLEEEDELDTSGGSHIHVLEELHENIKEFVGLGLWMEEKNKEEKGKSVHDNTGSGIVEKQVVG
jgi:hypothetical protein